MSTREEVPAPGSSSDAPPAAGDPLPLGLAVFCVGATALGLVLVGFIPARAVGIILPVITVATGLYQLVAVAWAIRLGQTIVALVLGAFSGFWFSLAALLLGLQHGWYAISAGDVSGAVALFYASWAVLFFFLLIVTLRLPLVYPLIVALVVLVLILVTVGTLTSSTVLSQVAGILVLGFALLGYYAFLNLCSVALGARAFPPLGRPPIQ